MAKKPIAEKDRAAILEEKYGKETAEAMALRSDSSAYIPAPPSAPDGTADSYVGTTSAAQAAATVSQADLDASSALIRQYEQELATATHRHEQASGNQYYGGQHYPAVQAAQQKLDAQNQTHFNLLNTFNSEQEVVEEEKVVDEAGKEYEEDGSTVVVPKPEPPPLVDPDLPPPTTTDPDTGETVPDTNPPIGTDPNTGEPVDPGTVPNQGGTLPPNFTPAYGSRDWLGHVMTPTEGLLPQQLERSGPIRRITPVSQLFNNPLKSMQDNRQGIQETAIAKALRSGNANSISGGNYYG